MSCHIRSAPTSVVSDAELCPAASSASKPSQNPQAAEVPVVVLVYRFEIFPAVR